MRITHTVSIYPFLTVSMYPLVPDGIRGLARGYEPLLFVALPEMPFWEILVPFQPS